MHLKISLYNNSGAPGVDCDLSHKARRELPRRGVTHFRAACRALGHFRFFSTRNARSLFQQTGSERFIPQGQSSKPGCSGLPVFKQDADSPRMVKAGGLGAGEQHFSPLPARQVLSLGPGCSALDPAPC